jgi:hypothetical protein
VDYIALSIADRVAASGGEGGANDATSGRMRILLDDENIARMDVDELVGWAELERSLWESEDFEKAAKYRTVEYVADKFLNHPTVHAWDLTNLNKLIDWEGALASLAAIKKGQFPGKLTNEQMRYAARTGRSLEMIVAAMSGHEVSGDAVYDISGKSTHRPSKKGGAKVHSVRLKSVLSVTQDERRLVFECKGGVRGTITLALDLAGVQSEHWKYTSGNHNGKYMIQANGVRIWIRKDKATIEAKDKATIREYEVDTSPSEWSSLWYTTPCAAVFPVTRAGTRSLAVFVTTGETANGTGGATAGGFFCPSINRRNSA